MDWFSIKDIENLCSIKAHTLRIWEQRYNLHFATRKEGKHRYYDNEALKKLLRISFLYNNGYKISKIASLSASEIEKLVDEFSSDTAPSSKESAIRKLIEAGLDFDRNKFIEVINTVLKKMGMEACITAIFYPFLQRIGQLWMTNHVIPAQEHFVSNIIRERIILAIEGLKVEENQNTKVLIFAPSGEFHELPLLTANYLCKKYGTQTIYFGVDTSLEIIEYFLNHDANASILFSHIITAIETKQLVTYFEELTKKWPEKKILVSGTATKCLKDNNTAVRFLNSMPELISIIKETA